MVRVKAMAPSKAAEEYRYWCEEARERYEERIPVFSDGGPVTPEMDWAARFEAAVCMFIQSAGLRQVAG